MTRRKAFSLPEMLVVMAIIAIVISMLVPSLAKAKENARRGICRAQMHQIHVAQLGNAAERKGNLAPHAQWDVQTIYSTSFGASWAATTEKFYTGSGMLWYRKYLGDAKAIWCPSVNSPNIAFDSVNGWRLKPNVTGNGRWIAQPMVQRTNVLKVNSAAYPSSNSFFSDGFDYSTFYYQNGGDAVLNAHREGYNFIRLDGSASWYSDPTGKIAALRVVSGKTPAAFVAQEAVFRDYFDK